MNPQTRNIKYCLDCRPIVRREQEYRAHAKCIHLKKMKPDPDKLKCPFCGEYHIQLLSHITQKHEITAKEFKLEFGFDSTKGIIPEWFRKEKSESFFNSLEKFPEVLTENLKKRGVGTRFVKNHKRVYTRTEQTIKRLKHLPFDDPTKED